MRYELDLDAGVLRELRDEHHVARVAGPDGTVTEERDRRPPYFALIAFAFATFGGLTALLVADACRAAAVTVRRLPARTPPQPCHGKDSSVLHCSHVLSPESTAMRAFVFREGCTRLSIARNPRAIVEPTTVSHPYCSWNVEPGQAGVKQRPTGEASPLAPAGLRRDPGRDGPRHAALRVLGHEARIVQPLTRRPRRGRGLRRPGTLGRVAPGAAGIENGIVVARDPRFRMPAQRVG